MPENKKEALKKFTAMLKAASEKAKKIAQDANAADASVDQVEQQNN